MNIEFFEDNLRNADEKQALRDGINDIGEEKIVKVGRIIRIVQGMLNKEIGLMIWMETGQYILNIWQDMERFRIIAESFADIAYSGNEKAVVEVDELQCWSKDEIISEADITQKMIEKSVKEKPKDFDTILEDINKKWCGEKETSE